jgi:hypothetical protein
MRFGLCLIKNTVAKFYIGAIMTLIYTDLQSNVPILGSDYPLKGAK